MDVWGEVEVVEGDMENPFLAQEAWGTPSMMGKAADPTAHPQTHPQEDLTFPQKGERLKRTKPVKQS